MYHIQGVLSRFLAEREEKRRVWEAAPYEAYNHLAGLARGSLWEGAVAKRLRERAPGHAATGR